MTRGMALKFYTSVTKGLQIKVRKFWGLISTFVEVTMEKLVGVSFCTPPILNRVKGLLLKKIKFFFLERESATLTNEIR